MKKILLYGFIFSYLFIRVAYADTVGNSTTVQLIVSSPSQTVTTATPVSGMYMTAVIVSLTCTDTGGVGCGSTYYTTDGNLPTISSSVYTGPITISSNTDLQYFSTDKNGDSGNVDSQVYIIDAMPPVTTAHPRGGIYSTAQSVTLSCTDDNSGCDKTYYTIDGTVPTASSTQYSVTNPIFITSTTLLRFFSTDLAGNNESPQTQTYIISATSSPPVGYGIPPSTTGGGFFSGNQTFMLENIVVQAGTTTATITWYTNEPSVSVFSWNSDMVRGSSGSVSEISYVAQHAILIKNLQSDEEYTVDIEAVSVGGAILHDTFFVQTLPLSYPPPNVTDFTATCSFGGDVILSWINPLISDLSSIIITRGTRFFPRDPTEGYIVYQGKGESVLDLNTEPDNEYYYSAFTENTDSIFSSGIGIQFLTNISASSTATSGAVIAAPLFGGIVSMLPTADVSRILFLNNNTVLTPTITSSSSNPFITVGIDPSLPLTVIIPASIVPRDTEEVVMKVSDQRNSGGNLFFLFKKLNDGSYQSIVPANFDYKEETSAFIISFLSVGYEVRVNGAFVMQATNASQSVGALHGSGNHLLFYFLVILLILLLLITVFFIIFGISITKKDRQK